jgi:hypothetical protein
MKDGPSADDETLTGRKVGMLKIERAKSTLGQLRRL